MGCFASKPAAADTGGVVSTKTATPGAAAAINSSNKAGGLVKEQQHQPGKQHQQQPVTTSNGDKQLLTSKASHARCVLQLGGGCGKVVAATPSQSAMLMLPDPACPCWHLAAQQDSQEVQQAATTASAAAVDGGVKLPQQQTGGAGSDSTASPATQQQQQAAAAADAVGVDDGVGGSCPLMVLYKDVGGALSEAPLPDDEQQRCHHLCTYDILDTVSPATQQKPALSTLTSPQQHERQHSDHQLAPASRQSVAPLLAPKLSWRCSHAAAMWSCKQLRLLLI